MDFDDATGLLYLSCGNRLYRANTYTGTTVLLGPTPASSALEVIGSCGPPPPTTLSAHRARAAVRAGTH